MASDMHEIIRSASSPSPVKYHSQAAGSFALNMHSSGILTVMVSKEPPVMARSGLIMVLYASLSSDFVWTAPQFTDPATGPDVPSRSTIMRSPSIMRVRATLTGSLPIPSSSRKPSRRYVPSASFAIASRSMRRACSNMFRHAAR